MESFNTKKIEKKRVSEKVSNLIKATLLSGLMYFSKIHNTLAKNLYTNRILEEELIAPNKHFKGINPPLPEGTKIISIGDAFFANIGNKMYWISSSKDGFRLIDLTKDFIPQKTSLRRINKRRADFQKNMIFR